MKFRYVALGTIAASLLVATGCSSSSDAGDGTKVQVEIIRTTWGADIGIFTDPETGCQSYTGTYGLTGPRMNPDGMTQRCLENNNNIFDRPAQPPVDPKDSRASDLSGNPK